MYGYRLRALTEVLMAFLLGVVLTFFGVGMSWSENAVDEMDMMHPLLNGLLLSASWAFKTLAHEYVGGEDVLYRPTRKKVIRINHLLFHISYGFGAILIMQMDSLITSDFWHFLATGYTVVCLALLVTGYFKTWTFLWHLFTWSILGSGLWLAASLLFDVSLVRYPEFALMVVGLVLVLTMLFSKKE